MYERGYFERSSLFFLWVLKVERGKWKGERGKGKVEREKSKVEREK
jgi:hypothetical protein